MSLQELRDFFQEIVEYPRQNQHEYKELRTLATAARRWMHEMYLPQLKVLKALIWTTPIVLSKQKKYTQQHAKLLKKLTSISEVEYMVYVMVDTRYNPQSPLLRLFTQMEQMRLRYIHEILIFTSKKSPIHYWIEEFAQFERLVKESVQRSQKKLASQIPDIQTEKSDVHTALVSELPPL